MKKVSRGMTSGSSHEIPAAQDSKELDRLIAWRREFHAYPEIRWTEFWTTIRIIEIVKGLGFDVLYGEDLYQTIDGTGIVSKDLRRTVPDEMIMEEAFRRAGERSGDLTFLGKMKGGLTGLIARMKGGKSDPGMIGNGTSPKFGFRVDIDGLPLKESDDPGHFPSRKGFASTNGNMHACGHDGHIAIGLGLAKMISENIEQLAGEYWILFQRGGGGGMGGEIFSHLEFLKELDHFIAVHLGLIGGRKLSCGLGFMDANAYSVEFRGWSTHSAVAPNEGKNALLAACTAVANLYAIPRHGDGASRVNVGEFHSDNAMNVISDKATFTYQSRGENPAIADYMDHQAARIIESAAQMYDVAVEIRREGKYVSAPNDQGMKGSVRAIAIELGIDTKAIIEEFKLPGSEDAPYLMNAVQKGGGEATFIGLGCNTRGGHHNPTFDIDEDLLQWGVDILYGIVKQKNEK